MVGDDEKVIRTAKGELSDSDSDDDDSDDEDTGDLKVRKEKRRGHFLGFFVWCMCFFVLLCFVCR